MEYGKISSRQLTLLIFTLLVSTAILILPSLVIKEAKQDSWLSIILATVFGVLAGLILVKLGLRFPEQTIIEYSKEIAGKPLGALYGLSYIFLLFYINTLIVREF